MYWYLLCYYLVVSSSDFISYSGLSSGVFFKSLLFSFEDSKLNSFLEGDDELILAISNSKSKQSINVDQLPLTAKTTIDTDYSSMNSENSYEVPKLGYEVNMRGILPTNLGEKEDVFFAKNGRELISKKGFKDYDKSGKDGYKVEKKSKKVQ